MSYSPIGVFRARLSGPGTTAERYAKAADGRPNIEANVLPRLTPAFAGSRTVR